MTPAKIIDECKRFHDCITADVAPEDQLLVALALRFHFWKIADIHNKITAAWEPTTTEEPEADIAEIIERSR